MTNFSCLAIHNNIRIQGNYQSGVSVLPCCVYRTKKIYSTLEQYNSSEEIQQLKTTTTWPLGCGYCKKQEDAGQTSTRMLFEKTWPDPASRSKTRFEIFPSNVCNLKCPMCSSDSSTALALERYQLNLGNLESVKEFDITDASIEILTSVPSHSIDSISIIGGEFFLSKGSLTILDFVLDNNIPLRAVTNATIILPAHLDRLKKISNLELQISVDGVQESYEFMRYPAKWNTVVNNIKSLATELKGQRLNFHYVVQTLNVQNLVPSLEYLNKFLIPTRVTNLVDPEYLSWLALTPDEKFLVVKNLQQQITQHAITRQQKEYVMNLCDTISQSKFDPALRDRFIIRISDTLRLRKLSIATIKSQFGILSDLFSAVQNSIEQVKQINPLPLA